MAMKIELLRDNADGDPRVCEKFSDEVLGALSACGIPTAQLTIHITRKHNDARLDRNHSLIQISQTYFDSLSDGEQKACLGRYIFQYLFQRECESLQKWLKPEIPEISNALGGAGLACGFIGLQNNVPYMPQVAALLMMVAGYLRFAFHKAHSNTRTVLTQSDEYAFTVTGNLQACISSLRAEQHFFEPDNFTHTRIATLKKLGRTSTPSQVPSAA